LVAGCSSSSDGKDASTRNHGAGRSTSTSTTTTAASSTTGAPVSPPCTVDAATAALPVGTKAVGVVCSDGWASGSDTNGDFDAAFLLRADGAVWRTLSPTETEQACGPDNAMGIPAGVLAQSPCEVS
jgi:hypothetical protein